MASIQGSKNFAERFKDSLPLEHFRVFEGYHISSIGIGTYLGSADDENDQQYLDAILKTVLSGCNVIDTAINYRCQRSERVIATAIKQLSENHGIDRNELLISTKGGFIPFDNQEPSNPIQYFEENFERKGIASKEDIVAGCHILTVDYIEHQIYSSLKNLDVEMLDVYYLHNIEMQLQVLSRKDFSVKIQKIFKFLEEMVKKGLIQYYGTATWDGYRVAPEENQYLSLEELIFIARENTGQGHHFKAIQLPYNLAYAEAYLSLNQKNAAGMNSILDIARRYGMMVFASAPLMQGALLDSMDSGIINSFDGDLTAAQAGIQFVRSTPGITAAIVGMKQVTHVAENIKAAQYSPLGLETFKKIFSK